MWSSMISSKFFLIFVFVFDWSDLIRIINSDVALQAQAQKMSSYHETYSLLVHAYKRIIVSVIRKIETKINYFYGL